MKPRLILAGTFLFSHLAIAQIPPQVGWYEIPNSLITSVADPTYETPSNICQTTPTQCGLVSMIRAWSGGDFDQNGNRLFVWGGGHSDYLGNEVYAFSLTTLTWTRLSNASNPFCACAASSDHCRQEPDGQIDSMHTYDSMAFDAHVNRLIQFNGGGNNCAWVFNDLWEFNPTATSNPWWHRKILNGIWGASEGIEATYDPARQLVFFHDYITNGFFSYDYDTNTATRLTSHSREAYQYTNFIDTKRHRYLEFGHGQQYSTDIGIGSSYAQVNLSTTNTPALIGSTWPGVAYDSFNDKYVAWNGGTTVYLLDPNTNVWTSQTLNCFNMQGQQLACNVPVSRVANGTFGRWQYSNQSNAFVLQNEAYQNVFVLRLDAGIPDTTPPAVTNLQVSQTQSETITWQTDENSNSQVEYGQTIAYGNSTSLDSNLVTSHSVLINNLLPGIIYHYRVKSADASGNLTISLDQTF